MFEKLFSPIKIRDMQLPHRIIFPAMGTKFSGNESFETDKRIAYHVARVNGSSGLNIVEVASVHTPSAPRHFLSISDDKYIPGLKKLHKGCDGCHAAGKSQGIKAVLKVAHDGFKLLSCGVLNPGIVITGALSKPRMSKGSGLIYWKTDGAILIHQAPVQLLTLGVDAAIYLCASVTTTTIHFSISS